MNTDRNMLAQVNPVLDPLLLTPLRNAVVNSAWGRGKIDIPHNAKHVVRSRYSVNSHECSSESSVRELSRKPKVQRDQCNSSRTASASQRPNSNIREIRGFSFLPAHHPYRIRSPEHTTVKEQPFFATK